jgi:hypothetical protein
MWKPFVALLWGGTASVTIFFAISGYVLSYKPLKLLHAHNMDAYRCIASSVFRRGFRLFLPAIGTILLLAVLTQLRVFEAGRAIHLELNGLSREPAPPLSPSLVAQMKNALWDCYLLVATSIPGAHAEGDIFSYDKHVWTLPVEFKSSMALFILLMGTSILTSLWRLVVHVSVLLYCLYIGKHDTALFVGGMVMAEVDLLQAQNASAHASLPRIGEETEPEKAAPAFQSSRRLRKQFQDAGSASWLAVFVVGLFLLSIPGVEPVGLWPYTALAELLPVQRGDKNV